MPAVPSPRAILLRRWLPVALACALGALLTAGLVMDCLRLAPPRDPAIERYNDLARGFEAGHLYLARPVPPALAHLAHPYDSSDNSSVRGGLGKLLDLSYFNGRLYLYFGLVPEVAAFLPWHLVTGHWLPETTFIAVFATAGFLLGACLLAAAWRRHFPEADPDLAAGCILLLATGTTVPLITARPHVWEVPVAGAFAFLMAACGAAWLACQTRRTRARIGWLAATGLCAGLAVGCRANLVFASLLLTGAAAWGAASRGPAGRPRPNAKAAASSALPACLAAAFIPLAAVGAALAAYNWARFGDPLQFGQHYQLSSDNVHSRTVFSAAFLVENLRLYLLSALRWGPRFPFAWMPAVPHLSPAHGDVEHVVGILPALPALLLAACAPLAWRGRPQPEKSFLKGCAAALAGIFLLSAGVMLLFYGACNRYEVDFLPGLVLLACLGILGTDRAAAAWAPAGRLAWRAAAAALIAYSATAITLGSIARCEYTSLEEATDTQLVSKAPGARAAAVDIAGKLVAVTNGFDGYKDLGIVQGEADRPADAVRSLTEAARLDPDDFGIAFHLGVELMKIGRPADAARSLAQAASLTPDDFGAEFDLGMAEVQGHDAEGFDHLLDALRRHPNQVASGGNAGLVLVAAGRDREAVPLLRSALLVLPSSAPLQAALGKALLRLGSPAEGIPFLRRALLLAPPNADVLNDLGVALCETGARDEGAACFTRALQLSPGNEITRRNLATLRAGR